ncbi:vanillate O-demethylase ferredoxin subunit [Mesorhizobium sp. J18]|uniref:PDR/VanB family oxidoreductase n=1 Tax=Mesorhizobium sp. J18 TaxID=935263 RepID=UPI00119BDD3F|nr:PDR/VanB family oxidoreductase [Mesorhizobium sp. J18]TWG98285.1 vanillate O-demethylase ferredoxin subunit [Mesorhizobium sp. J18]
MKDLSFKVCEIVEETPRIRRVVLEGAGDMPLPKWTPGSHIRVKLPAGGDRPYSLVDLPQWRTGQHYVLGVLLEENSAGGSQYIHGLKVGDQVTASQPINQFELAEDEGEVLLLAGGVGITPIFSMAAELAKAGRDFSFHYLGRAQGELAFTGPLKEICSGCLHLHYDDTPPGRPDFGELIAPLAGDGHVYVCGPAGMIEAVKTAWALAGRPAERLHFELFTATPAPAGGDVPFDVEVKSTGQVVTVAPGQSIIDALEEAGLDVVYDCRRGDCGICQTEVLDGIPEHRDVVLTDEEKASNKVMQICVSRAKSPRLVLDL